MASNNGKLPTPPARRNIAARRTDTFLRTAASQNIQAGPGTPTAKNIPNRTWIIWRNNSTLRFYLAVNWDGVIYLTPAF